MRAAFKVLKPSLKKFLTEFANHLEGEALDEGRESIKNDSL